MTAEEQKTKCGVVDTSGESYIGPTFYLPDGYSGYTSLPGFTMVTEKSNDALSIDEPELFSESFETPHLISYTNCIFGISLGQKLAAEPLGFDATCVNPDLEAFYAAPRKWSAKVVDNVHFMA